MMVCQEQGLDSFYLIVKSLEPSHLRLHTYHLLLSTWGLGRWTRHLNSFLLLRRARFFYDAQSTNIEYQLRISPRITFRITARICFSNISTVRQRLYPSAFKRKRVASRIRGFSYRVSAQQFSEAFRFLIDGIGRLVDPIRR